MANPSWHQSMAGIEQFLFKIKTPTGSGTGFQILYSPQKDFCGIATAFHVISHEHEWEEPIKIVHQKTKEQLVLKEKDRVIYAIQKKDLAFILFHKGDLPITKNAPNLIAKNKILKQGVETGWCGFPAVSPNNLCFFSGHISCFLHNEDSYLVDGVAINGVSGGPAFYHDSKTGKTKICGVISAYMPNRATGESLPGLCVVRSVEPYQEVLQEWKSLDEAEEKAEIEKKKSLEKEVETDNDKQDKPTKAKKKKTTRKKKVAKKAK